MGSPAAAIGFLLYSTTRQKEGEEPESFDTTALRGLTNIEAGPGWVTCRMPVTRRVQNRNGTLHGGCTATLIDVVGTAALLTQAPKGGVSLAINSNYLAPMPGGGTVFIEAKLLRVGRSVATITVELKDFETGKLVAQGTHVKFISEGEPDLSELARKVGLSPLPVVVGHGSGQNGSKEQQKGMGIRSKL